MITQSQAMEKLYDLASAYGLIKYGSRSHVAWSEKMSDVQTGHGISGSIKGNIRQGRRVINLRALRSQIDSMPEPRRNQYRMYLVVAFPRKRPQGYRA